MSEAIQGVPPAPPPTAPRDAAVVVLHRWHGLRGDERAVYWVKRESSLRFAGGFWAFPGGRVDPDDARVRVTGGGGAAVAIAAAARELFEETGVLKATGAERLDQHTLEELRRSLLANSLAFSSLLSSYGLSLDAADFVAAGRWVTPASHAVRFDTRFFLVEAPAGQRAQVWKGELESGEWVRPEDALARWRTGQALLHPPNLHVLRVLDRCSDPKVAREQLLRPPLVDAEHCPLCAELQEGVVSFPLRTPTLPPATHTSAYVLGTGRCLVVDPGSGDPVELGRLVAYLERRAAPPLAVVLTHHHADHVGGVQALSARLGLAVWAHRETAARLRVPVDRHLDEGDTIDLDGPWPMRWRVLHTPGHTRGHLTLVEERSRAAVVGDMVAGQGTIVIDPPEGDMAEYMRQLERLKAHVGTLYPAHGPAIPDGVAKLDEYLAHRRWREEKVLGALTAMKRPATVGELMPLAYDEVPVFVWPVAERSTLAILQKLRLEGRAAFDGQRWSPRG